MTLAVNEQSDAVVKMALDWTLADALLGGTRTMREAGRTYLPKWPQEDDDSYAIRLAISVLFPVYQRTVQTLSGKPFSKPITLGEDIPARIIPWLDDIDLQGRNLDAFSADVFQASMGYGLAGILVEFPVRPEGVVTQAQEAAEIGRAHV